MVDMDNCTSSVNNVNNVFFLFQHRDTPDNNADTPFEFTEENLKVGVTSVLSHLGYVPTYI